MKLEYMKVQTNTNLGPENRRQTVYTKLTCNWTNAILFIKTHNTIFIFTFFKFHLPLFSIDVTPNAMPILSKSYL